MNLFITGISGFVGRRLTRLLDAAGDRVTGTYAGQEVEIPGATTYPVDVLESEAMAERIAEVDPDAVIHLAGLSHVGKSWSDPAAYFRVNFLGTERVLAAAAGRRVVLASSAEVYGPVPEEEQPIGEERPLAPGNPYAVSKAAAERLVLAAGGVVARTFNLVGPGQACSFALPAFAAQLAAIERGEQEPVLRVGNLSARRDFVPVDDGAAAFRLLAERGERRGVYNIATGSAISIGEALDRLRAISGVDARVEVDPQRMRPADVPLTTGDAGRLRALGWAPRQSVDDALAELWEAARRAPG